MPFYEELNVSIYSFPMKYHPIRHDKNGDADYSHNRDFIGKYWNRKYIRAIQAILNSTKGKISKGKTFFYKAFGKDEDQFLELLEMSETFILYRFFFEWLDNKSGVFGTAHWRKCWNKCMSESLDEEKSKLLDVIHHNNFDSVSELNGLSQQGQELLSYYTNFRKDMITPGTELYRLKKEYDSNPTIKLKRMS